MTGSLIHVAFDPQPYILFSACSVAIGILLEVGRTPGNPRRIAGYFRRSAAHPAPHVGDPTGLHALGTAKH